VGSTPPAAAQSQNRAAIIVHTGGGSAAVCVRFSEASISGLDALQRAGLGAAIRGFSGQGGAVCGINGTGCPADNSCLTCQAPNYWAYHRAGAGAGGFTFSSSGAGATQVTDGSVEGWQWGTGSAPPFQTVDQVCGAASPPPPTPAPDQPSSPAPDSGATGGGDSPASGPSETDDSPAATTVAPTTTVDTTTTAAPDDTPTTTEVSDGDRTVEGDLAASTTSEPDAGSPWATVLFLALLGGMAGAAFVIRRRRAS
jgi:hypothetical protein